MTDVPQLLAGVPLFAEFAPDELAAICDCGEERAYTKGEVLWDAGEPGDELVIVVEGELAVWGVGGIVARLGPGNAVGEIALLLDEPRSARVSATRHTRALVLGRADFDRFVRTDPRAILSMTAMLSRRLELTTRRQVAGRGSLVVAVTARPGQLGATLVSTALRVFLGRDFDVDVRAVDLGAERDLTPDSFPHWVEKLCVDAPVLILDAPARARVDPRLLLECADFVVDIAGDAAAPLASPEPHTRVLQVANAYTDPHARPSHSDADHFVVPHDTELALLDVAGAVRRLVDDRWRPMSRVIGRLARTIEGRVVGVALGAGAAFGLAHIGVLRVLDDAGIPIDVVAGSSIGAVIGTGYAAGATGAELEAIAYERSSFARLVGTVDVALTGDGLIAGRRLLSYLRPFLFGARDFDDCVLPMRTVASDLTHGEAVAIGEGSVELAVRASIAMPPVLTPVLVDGRTLVDGGIANPVPCNVVRDLGADVVIAVEVIPRLDADATTVLTRLSRGLNRINPLAYLSGRVDSQNVIDTIMNAFHLVEFELSTYQARNADIVVRPELPSHTWIEFYRAPELVAGGVAAGRDSLPQVRSVLAERVAAARPVA